MKTILEIQYIGFLTILRKELTRVFRIWTQTLLPSVITITLYFLIFGNVIGSQIDNIQSFSYIQFIVPGLIMMTIVNNAYSNVVSTVFGSKFQKNIEEMLVSPLHNVTIILGFLSGGVTRSVIVGILVTLVSSFFSPIHIFSFGVLIITLFLTAFLFSLLGFLNALFAKRFDDISIVPTFILTPLTYLGGVFYSIESLPVFWQNVSLLNPILYLVNCFRYGFLGISDIGVFKSLSILTLIVASFWYLCLFLLKKGVGLRQ